MNNKKILYIDMDDVLVNFQTGIDRLDEATVKDLNMGDYLVDDRDKNGALEFNGEFIHFGTRKFPDWKSVKTHLLNAQ
jgi:hypothetical protein